jgi:hypothetical protein
VGTLAGNPFCALELEVDCRVLSYDKFSAPPAAAFGKGAPTFSDAMGLSILSRKW